MNSSDCQKNYYKYKLIVKKWEKDFQNKYGRIPSKHDIREAPRCVRDSYKMYYNLKTSFLENTLGDVLTEDGFDLLDDVHSEYDLNNGSSAYSSEGPELPSNMSFMEKSINIDNELNDKSSYKVMGEINHCEETNKHFESTTNLEQNEKAWGKNVSKKTEKKENPIILDKKPILKLKISQMPVFQIRNPRKPIPRSALPSSSQQPNSENETEPLRDLETILIEKAKQCQKNDKSIVVETKSGLAPKSKKLVITNVDERWLDRCAVEEGLQPVFENLCDKNIQYNSCVPSNGTKSFGLSNLNVFKIIPKPEKIRVETTNEKESKETSPNLPDICKSDSDSVVSDSENETENRHIIKRPKLCLLNTNNKEASNSSSPPKTQSSASKSVENNASLMNRQNSDSNSSAEVSLLELKRRQTRKNDKVTNPKRRSLQKKSKLVLDSEKNQDVDGMPDTERKRVQTRKKLSDKSKVVNSEIKTKNTIKRISLAKNSKLVLDSEKNQEVECIPDTEDLKFNLALDNIEISLPPRIDAIDLESTNMVALSYLNKKESVATPNCSKKHQNNAVKEKQASAQQKLMDKMAAGKLNENYVQINIQKKVFVRGKKSVNFSKYKKKLWKEKKKVAALTGPDMDMRGCDGGVLLCFTCGQTGHFASKCTFKGDKLLPLNAQIEEDTSPFPTLEEAEQMALSKAAITHSRNMEKLPKANNSALYHINDNDNKTQNPDGCNINTNAAMTPITQGEERKVYVPHEIPESFLRKAGLLDSGRLSSANSINTLYDLNADGSVKEVTSEVLEVLRMFGHTDFRKGQERAIMRILSGLSTLVMLSTGSGKSLCYQLPAYMYSRWKKSITLVISPLVSLMEDQVTGVPHFLRAYCLHTNQTPEQRKIILQKIANNEIDILLVSPEAVVSGERSTGFGSILKQLPPIAFACIDEVHCVSQWSHNFRPSYLMICKVLKKNLGITTVLGLTATATLPTRMSITQHLGITDGEKGIISDIPLPDNLLLSVSKDENRDAALIQLLKSSRFGTCQSIIIYCTRRDECERVAGIIRTCMQSDNRSSNIKKRKRINWQAEPYHAGLPSSRRRTIQNAFMKNDLRIVVATIAFGMGINKPDIRAVIHYNMPRNFESYVQEIGRAGRDGKIAHCHLFLDSKGDDQMELRRHVYANSIDRHVIRKLLQSIFVKCSCSRSLEKEDRSFDDGHSISEKTEPEKNHRADRVCYGHEIGFSVEKTVQLLDIPEENISTLLCFMELDSRWNINILSSAYMMCKVISYGGPKYLKQAAKDCPPLAMAIALEIKRDNFKEDSNVFEFGVIDIAAAIGWNSGIVKHQLKSLEWTQADGYPRRSVISVNFFDLGFRIMAPGDFTNEELDEALDYLYNRSIQQEQKQLIQLQYVFEGLSSVSYPNYIPCTSENFNKEQSDRLKVIVREYFQNDYQKNVIVTNVASATVPDDFIINDVLSLINMYPENNFTGRNIARIFHGIQSPNYPALIWSKCKYWRAHIKADFNHVIQLANEIILKMK